MLYCNREASFSLLGQDISLIDFDMEALVLHVYGEQHARTLHCKLLEPEEGDTDRPMNTAEVQDLFSSAFDTGNGELAEEENEENGGDDEEEDLDNDAMIEAANLIPEQPVDMGDGGLPEDIVDIPEIPKDIQLGVDEIIEDDGYVMEEEVTYEAPSKNHIPNEGPQMVSSSATSSKGLCGTPADLKHCIPVGAKLQRKMATTAGRCSGWQAWRNLASPSRWFSFGVNGRYANDQDALKAASAWLWDSD